MSKRRNHDAAFKARLRDRNPRAAGEWLAGIRDTMRALGGMPEAHPIAPESGDFIFRSAVRVTARRHAGVSNAPSPTGRCNFCMSVMAAGVTGNPDPLNVPRPQAAQRGAMREDRCALLVVC